MYAQQYPQTMEIVQQRPDIGRVLEETVANLKELENRVELLKNDLISLSTRVGHHDAARFAATIASPLGRQTGVTGTTQIGQPLTAGVQGSIGTQSFSPLAQQRAPQELGFQASPMAAGLQSTFSPSMGAPGVQQPLGSVSPAQAWGSTGSIQTQPSLQAATPGISQGFGQAYGQGIGDPVTVIPR